MGGRAWHLAAEGEASIALVSTQASSSPRIRERLTSSQVGRLAARVEAVADDREWLTREMAIYKSDATGRINF